MSFFYLFTLFILCSLAANVYNINGAACSSGTTLSSETTGYNYDVLIIDSDFDFDTYQCLIDIGSPIPLFKGSISVTVSVSSSISTYIEGIIFEEESNVIFEGDNINSFEFGGINYYELRLNSIITYRDNLYITSNISISNSSTLIINGLLDIDCNLTIVDNSVVNVNGFVWSHNSVLIENGILNVYQFSDYTVYNSYSTDTLMGIYIYSNGKLNINNGEINIYGSSYTDTNNYFTSSTYGLWAQSNSQIKMSGNSNLTLFLVDSATYLFGFTIADPDSLIMNDNSVILTPFFKQNGGILEVNNDSFINIQNGECSLNGVAVTSSKTIQNSPLFQSENNLFEFSSNTITSTTCFDMFSSFEINTNDYDGLINKCNERLKRYCPDTVEDGVFCEFSGSTWVTEFTVDTNPFNYFHCMNNCGGANCYIKSLISEPITIENEPMNVTFIDDNVTLYFNAIPTVNMRINSIEVVLTTTSKSGIYSNLISKTLKQSTEYVISTSYLIPPTNDTVFIVDNMECGFGYINENGFNCLESYDCPYGYYRNNQQCNECPINCKTCSSSDNCYLCESGYVLKDGYCNEDTNCTEANRNYCNKCKDGFHLDGNACTTCSVNCISCNSDICYTCNETLNDNGICQNILNAEVLSNNSIVQCSNDYYSNGETCELCTEIYSNCETCSYDTCIKCANGYYLNNNTCESMNCLNPENITNGYCGDCDTLNGYIMDENGKCVLEIVDCIAYINGKCVKCSGDLLATSYECINEVDNCITTSSTSCIRCSEGYYLNDDNFCEECPGNCSTCHSSTYCLECNNGYMLNDNNECIDESELSTTCKYLISGSLGGCAICNDGYYRNETYCNECISNCSLCENSETCVGCESAFFLLNDASECISYDELTNCRIKTQSGCSKCSSGYYINNQYCSTCSSKTENCNTCNSNNGKCLTCLEQYVLANGDCVHYQLIDNCKESSDSKCTSCSFGMNQVKMVVNAYLIFIFAFLMIFCIFVFFVMISFVIGVGLTFGLAAFITRRIFDWRQQKKQEDIVNIFPLKTSKIAFLPTSNKDIVINREVLLFDWNSTEIPIDEETKDLICVGNTSKHTIKAQFSVKEGCDKYEIRTNPQIIAIPKGKAVEFEIFIKPLCTCKIDDQIMLISVNLSKGKTFTTPIKITATTIVSSRLDDDELHEEQQIGEGSFGIVFKGTFRGHTVAIKKLRKLSNNKESMEEFNKEVSMLDKFRCDYIVHFFGAVMIPNKICMVTEFAQYSSLHDLMKKQKHNPPRYFTRVKLLIDCGKGVEYLHSNGILHRDIKPDNFLIFSLDDNDSVNAKLTDFGSSRNVNSLMTNITFTKGIGTPKYMAPEVLNRQKYEKPADVYSFAITMYESFNWDEAYPKEKFIYPWDIAEFVTKGERLPKPLMMSEDVYSLISNCWNKKPKERYSIEDVVNRLGALN